jgi:predicted helicase
MNIAQYISNISTLYKAGNSTEHSYRGDLQLLLSTILEGISVTNEPKRIKCGAPDYILTRKDVPVGYIEAKDVGVNLADKAHKDQFDRYKAALNNLIITDYLQFHFYKNGEHIETVVIGEIFENKVRPIQENFDYFTTLIKNFGITVTQSIKSPEQLAKMMASKARLMANVIFQSLEADDLNKSKSELQEQREAFKSILIHDIDNLQFSDIYSQTIAYGLFAARYHDPTLSSFSREESARLIPHSNPFLRKLFQSVATYNLEENNVGQRLLWVVEELVQVFLATDVADIMKNFGRKTRQEDPVIHFYETFLSSYDPVLRKARGVWYTPEPVVNFIVRSVDEILKTKFNLSRGLADNSKIKIKIKTDKPDGRMSSGYVELEKEVHRLQILDPAAGTGTFLAKTIEHIYSENFMNMAGAWSAYVKDDLLPRLNGFEILMASYAMAHLKIDMLLTNLGYKTDETSNRLKIYLTNSLEEHHPDTGTLFSSWLSSEANEANHIKRDAPVMVVMGNPPYSVSSNNKNEWIQKLLFDYKKDLNERKINLDDDYIKFIRFGQHYIDKNGDGVLAYISNNSFIDGITHRQMRKSLLESFDEIYILDLHGNAKKQEESPDGSKDENVFDIMQGVSINLFIKIGRKAKDKIGKLFHYEIYGKREQKYDKLNSQSFANIPWKEIEIKSPYFFVPKDFKHEDEYLKNIDVSELFVLYSSGIESQKDQVAIKFTTNEIEKISADFKSYEPSQIQTIYSISDTRDWKIALAKEDLLSPETNITNILYRPFDIRKTYYSGRTKGFIAYPRYEVMKHLINKDNLGFIFKRGFNENAPPCFISKTIIDRRTWSRPGMQGGESIAPLYIYSDDNMLETKAARLPNLNMVLVNKIAEGLSLTFTNEKTDRSETFSPVDLLDYVYAVLHSPLYRERYKEFLKIDFPRVPYPKDKNNFWLLVALGEELRQLHLLEDKKINQLITKYPENGSNIVNTSRYQNEKVYINDVQYFADVPKFAWEFYVGGYQPAQKWLKDRKGLTLSFEDILHYQKIIKVLVETSHILKKIDDLNLT